MKKLAAMLLLASVNASGMTVTQEEITLNDIPPIHLTAVGQKIHVPPHRDIYVTGLTNACFRNTTTQTKIAHYVFTVKGMGKEGKQEGDLTLTKHSAMCATNNTYFQWTTGNAGLFGYDVIVQGSMSGQTKSTTAKGTVYVGQ